GALRQERDVATEAIERDAERIGAGAERVQHAAREVGRRRGHLGGEELAGAIDDRAIGERAADVDADEITHAVYISGHLRRLPWRLAQRSTTSRSSSRTS